MELRRRTEEKLRRIFIEGGGIASRQAPHYFVLGECTWFEGLAADMQAVRLSLDDLPSLSTSITYPDSFVSMGIGVEYGLPDVSRPYHGTAYTLDDLPDLIAEFGLPDDAAEKYEGYAFREFEKFIEIQLWTDEPIEAAVNDWYSKRA